MHSAKRKHESAKQMNGSGKITKEKKRYRENQMGLSNKKRQTFSFSFHCCHCWDIVTASLSIYSAFLCCFTTRVDYADRITTQNHLISAPEGSFSWYLSTNQNNFLQPTLARQKFWLHYIIDYLRNDKLPTNFLRTQLYRIEANLNNLSSKQQVLKKLKG